MDHADTSKLTLNCMVWQQFNFDSIEIPRKQLPISAYEAYVAMNELVVLSKLQGF